MAKSVTAVHLDRRLGEHPHLMFSAARDDARLAVSTAGIFVVVGDVGGVTGAAEGAYELARMTRTSLADAIMPTPHVESVVVSREAPRQTHDSLVIFLYQLPKLLEAGSRIDSETLERVHELVSSNSLAPGWKLQTPASDSLAA